MNSSELCSIIEAILFAAGEPVPFDRLCRGAACEPIELAAALDNLDGMYRFDRRGIRLVRVNETAQLTTAPEYAEQIRAALEMRRAPALSQPALEVLAIIAANQPVTRAYIEQVRGVDSSYTVGVLMEKGIVEEAGRLDVPGRPMLLRPTPEFLRIFGVSSYEELAELPEIRSLKAEEPKQAGQDALEESSTDAAQESSGAAETVQNSALKEEQSSAGAGEGRFTGDQAPETSELSGHSQMEMPDSPQSTQDTDAGPDGERK